MAAELAAVSVALLVAMGVVWVRTSDSDGPEIADRPGASYAFLARTAHGRPVGYDPCTPIRVAVNPRHAPEYYDAMVTTVLQRVENISGLDFRRVGTTDDRDLTDRDDPVARLAAEPVLIAWADEEEDPRLSGDVAGVGGSVMVRRHGVRWYVTGTVVLDAEEFDDDTLGLRTDVVRAEQRAVLAHEVGHLLGLAHVDDPGELMYDQNVGRRSYGPGDEQGLRILGSLPCR